MLVGFMGAGKTVVGRELARRMGLPFVDTDALIVAAHGSIPEIFATQGEAGFRALESAVVVRELQSLAGAPKVVALGGGAVLSVDVRVALAQTEHVVWLKAPAPTLWQRASADGGRPLARDEAAFAKLLAAREELYCEVANDVVDTSSGDAAKVAEAILSRIGARSTPAVPLPGRKEGPA